MKTKRKLKVLTDPGHGWLSVTLKDIATLGIEDKISSCSYMNASRAYLEEDCDMKVFMDAAKLQGWDISLTTSHTDSSHYVRDYPMFNAYFAKHPLAPGSEVTITSTGVQGVIEDMKTLVCQFGNRYKLKSNPLIGLTPPVDA